MENLLAADTTPLPFLAGAFERLLEEFPSTHNGLTRSEQQALRVVAESGSTTAGRMFLAIQNMEERSFIGDTSFWRILTRLAAEPHPLLHISWRTEESFSKRTVDITELGRQVLAGNEDYVRLRGIDRWIGAYIFMVRNRAGDGAVAISSHCQSDTRWAHTAASSTCFALMR